MFGMLEKLTKAAVAVAVTPVALAVDTVMIPFDAENRGDVYSRTTNLLESAGKNISKAVDNEEK